MSLTLYYHPLSSYCHKVLIALYENGIEFDRRIIDLTDAADRAELQALWPIGKFPVLRDHARQRNLPESSVIIEYLDRLYPGEQRLVPDDGRPRWRCAYGTGFSTIIYKRRSNRLSVIGYTRPTVI